MKKKYKNIRDRKIRIGSLTCLPPIYFINILKEELFAEKTDYDGYYEIKFDDKSILIKYKKYDTIILLVYNEKSYAKFTIEEYSHSEVNDAILKFLES